MTTMTDLTNAGMSFSDYNGQQVRTDSDYMEMLSQGAQRMGMTPAEYNRFLNPTTYQAPGYSNLAGTENLGAAPQPTAAPAAMRSAPVAASMAPASASALSGTAAPASTSLAGLYQQYFNRAPDTEGYNFWNNALSNGVSLAQIASEFQASPEYQQLHPNAATQPGINAATAAASATAAATSLSNPYNPYAGMRWDDIMNQARNDWRTQTTTDYGNGGAEQFNGTTTHVNGNLAQINLRQGPDINGWGPSGPPPGAVQDGEGNWSVPLDSDWSWNNATLNVADPNYVAPDGTTDWNHTLSRGADGSIVDTPYKRDNSIPMGLIAVVAAPFIAAYLGAGAGLAGAEGASGASGVAGSAAAGAGEMSVADTIAAGLSDAAAAGGSEVAWALPSYEGAIAAGTAGAADLASTIGATTDPVASNGWISAEGGTGYAVDPITGAIGPTDVATTTLPVTSGGWVSPEGGSGYTVDPATGATVPVSGPPGTMNGTPWNPTPSLPGVPGATTPHPTVPGVGGTGGGSGTGTGAGGNGMNWGSLLSTLYGMYSRNQISNRLSGILTNIQDMYRPGSPEALNMQHQLDARDAAMGRRSQYGPRSVELNAKLADARMRALTSPGFMTMEAAMLNNAPSTGGLSDLFGALQSGSLFNGNGTEGGNILNSILQQITQSGGSSSDISDFINNNSSWALQNGVSLDDLYSMF